MSFPYIVDPVISAAIRRANQQEDQPVTAPAAPAKISPHAAATAVAGTGFFAGLAAIFLPLLQLLPDQISPAVVRTAIASGVALCVSAIVGKLAHSGYLTKTEGTLVTAVAEPLLTTAVGHVEHTSVAEDLAGEAKKLAGDAKAKVDALEARIGAPAVIDVEKVAQAVLAHLAAGAGPAAAAPAVPEAPAEAPAEPAA